MRLDYIAIIVSSEKCLEFYHKPGFVESKRIARSNDSVVFMKTEDTTLEIFIDSRHPERRNDPETLGLRHIAFVVSNLDELVTKLD